MWWSMCIVLPGESIKEAMLNEAQFICAFDGSVHGDRQAKKMAKKVGHEYIRQGQIGTPRLVKTLEAPYDEEERQGLTDLIDSFSNFGV
jgi:hypothetical protein